LIALDVLAGAIFAATKARASAAFEIKHALDTVAFRKDLSHRAHC
jgi:hypothetical protein